MVPTQLRAHPLNREQEEEGVVIKGKAIAELRPALPGEEEVGEGHRYNNRPAGEGKPVSSPESGYDGHGDKNGERVVVGSIGHAQFAFERHSSG